ncbi:dipeptide ABC transporter ATP-binding protein [Cellulomonas aerilata]|uniref:ABC transporter ATP-binding protein n=1 Tax=Cellulomonas aerilata TaxID=515326 RepID=A0A512DBS4_9CELL|nr:ABC transporter ATP-binding protein [Cellulomonas aerilata]GEO33931.1 ABC transporter ATP-binding protein [Cellulomonas aerilata]
MSAPTTTPAPTTPAPTTGVTATTTGVTATTWPSASGAPATAGSVVGPAVMPSAQPLPDRPAAGRAPVPAVTVEDLHIAFGRGAARREVVHGVSFTVARGECLALVGESGSGKSVTARSLVGLTGAGAQVRAASLALGGTDLLRFGERDWRRLRGGDVGLVLQDALVSLDPVRAVGREIDEALRLHTRLTRAERAERVVELLDHVGVPDPDVRARQLPHELSGGLRQRALIAGALAGEPDLLIADEPTTALDVTVQAQVLDLLARLRDEGRTLLVISHDLAVVSRLADRVAVMQDGRIVETGPTASVLTDPQHPYTRRLLAAVPAEHAKGTRLSVPVAVPPDAPAAELADAPKDAATDAPTGVPTDPPAGRPAEAVAARVPSPDRHPVGEVVARLDGVARSFAGPDGQPRVAVREVSFTLRAGETLGIVGESGSGKTTTARILLGLTEPTAGTVEVHGRSWSGLTARERRALRRDVQVVHQDPLSSFDPRHAVGRILGDALGVAGVPRSRRRDRAVQLLEQVGLTAEHLDRRPRQMSGGQRQRVAIARALAPAPRLIVCDEPVSALDVSVQAQVLDLLADVQAETGVAYLFISHDLGVIHHVSDRVLVLSGGEVVEHGDVRDVFSAPQHPYTQRLIAAVPRIATPATTSSATPPAPQPQPQPRPAQHPTDPHLSDRTAS